MPIWGTPKFGSPKSSKLEKEKLTFFKQTDKLPSATLFSKLNIESQHIKAVNRRFRLTLFLA